MNRKSFIIGIILLFSIVSGIAGYVYFLDYFLNEKFDEVDDLTCSELIGDETKTIISHSLNHWKLKTWIDKECWLEEEEYNAIMNDLEIILQKDLADCHGNEECMLNKKLDYLIGKQIEDRK